ncbi:MAG TPA: hypothetical protein VKE70_13195 [Candidatus Solibacter sp.]|nr:hypothetical protein [Candidatus Solibacter sp.]
MTNPPMLEDISRLLLALAAPAALLCLVLAGIALRREGGTNFSLGGGFSRWMFWTVVFITLPQLLSWFPNFGVPATPPSGGIGIGWMASVASDLTSFVTNFVVNRLAPVLAAFFVLRAALDVADGSSPLGSVIAAMFLLSIPSTAALLRGWNNFTPNATADVLAALWTYVVSQILPIAAGLAIIAAIWAFWQNRRWMHYIAAAGGFLMVAALWQLIRRMMV